jgi:3-deoxy-D-manno-octulosonate 8-phosphate phosphatase (KDO 8-P phosphatase)
LHGPTAHGIAWVVTLQASQVEHRARAARVRLAVFDVDGVLTDGTLTYGPQGEALKTFSVHDGHGIVLLREAGVTCAILSARDSDIVRARMRDLRVPHVLQGERDKRSGFERLLGLTGVAADEVAYIGDDVNDLPVLDLVGLSACPADAAPEVRTRVHLVCTRPGGRGAVRELCELILKARGSWPA